MIRSIVSVMLVAGVIAGAWRATTANAPVPSAVGPCTARSLARAFDGPFALDAINLFGCSGRWAYAWATVGSGVSTVSVTEVFQYDQVAKRWEFASRSRYCHSGLIPSLVYQRGCFSN